MVISSDTQPHLRHKFQRGGRLTKLFFAMFGLIMAPIFCCGISLVAALFPVYLIYLEVTVIQAIYTNCALSTIVRFILRIGSTYRFLGNQAEPQPGILIIQGGSYA